MQLYDPAIDTSAKEHIFTMSCARLKVVQAKSYVYGPIRKSIKFHFIMTVQN
jgi:hypothetical protein